MIHRKLTFYSFLFAESDTQRDLFSLMDDDPAPLPISTTSAFNQPTPQASSAPPPPPARQASTNTRGPFDDDFFGSPAPAAAPAASAASPAPIAPNGTGNRTQPPAPTSAFVGDSGAELGNKQLQLDNTTKAVSSLQTQRSDLSTAVSTGASSLAEIESRLAQARATHESESKLVSELQARQRAQSESLKTSREELIRAESDLSALKAEKDEVEQAVMRDREDVRDLQRRMTAVQSETSELKIQLEKLKKEARQKKGMVAIGKKQLATAEGEHEKVGQEIKAVESGEMEEEAPVAPTASAVEVKAVSPKSPTGALSPSSVRSLNPFDRIGSGATEERSQSPSISTVGLGAGAGAALGLAGAAAVHGASTTSEDREATQGESTHQPSSSSGFDDAFGAPPASNTNDISAVPAFDDDFGSGFDATSAPSKEATAEGGNATAFDDAFADFGSQPKEAAAEAEPSQPPVSDGFEESFAPVATSAATQETEEPSASTSIPTSQPVTAPEVEEPASSSAEQPTPTQDDSDDEDDVPLSETSAAKRKSRLLGASELSQSSTPAQQDEQEDDSSDDEANEPEDLDSQPNRLRGASDATETQATALQQEREAPLPPAKSSNQASDRFPELPNPAEEPSMMMPGAIQTSDPQELTLPEEGESREAPGGLSSSTSTGSMLSSIPGDGRTSRMTNDGDDAFHDAFDEAPASSEPAVPGDNSNAFLAPASGAALASSGAPSTFSTSSQQGSEVGHERFSTAAVGDDELGSSAATSTSPLSSMTIPAPAGTTPASTLAAKTRRAPPPAPVRNPTSLTPTGGAGSGSAQLANDPFAPSNPAQSNQQASFDDFDSAFEDLGATSGTQSSNATGFDDAFGADSDFDFVPSFAQQSSGAPQATSSNKDNAFDGLGQSQQAAATNSNSFGGFDDFDSAFNPDGATSNAAAPAAGPTSSNSTSGSGFSFEDAFDPSQASAPAAGAPPSLPARGVEAAPSQSATTAPQSDNALPDDAQQVKQLCGMGFTRSKVIKALEKSNYRTEKALEKLLAEA